MNMIMLLQYSISVLNGTAPVVFNRHVLQIMKKPTKHGEIGQDQNIFYFKIALKNEVNL